MIFVATTSLFALLTIQPSQSDPIEARPTCSGIVEPIYAEHRDSWIADVGDHPILQLRVVGEFRPDVLVLLSLTEPLGARVFVAPAELCSQLAELRKARGADSKSLVEGLLFPEIPLSEAQLGAVRELARELPPIRSSVGDALFSPNMSIDFWLSSSGEEVRARVNVPDPSADGVAYAGDPMPSQPDLETWALRVLAAVLPATPAGAPAASESPREIKP